MAKLTEEQLRRAETIQECQLWPYEGPVHDFTTQPPNKKHTDVLSKLVTVVAAMEWYSGDAEEVTLENVTDLIGQHFNNYIGALAVIDEVKGSVEDFDSPGGVRGKTRGTD